MLEVELEGDGNEVLVLGLQFEFASAVDCGNDGLKIFVTNSSASPIKVAITRTPITAQLIRCTIHSRFSCAGSKINLQLTDLPEFPHR